MLTKEEYINLCKNEQVLIPIQRWSEPMYKCEICGGYVRKNLHQIIYLATDPPKKQYEYQCEKCHHTDYLPY